MESFSIVTQNLSISQKTLMPLLARIMKLLPAWKITNPLLSTRSSRLRLTDLKARTIQMTSSNPQPMIWSNKVISWLDNHQQGINDLLLFVISVKVIAIVIFSEEIPHINEGGDDGQDECLNNGIKIKEILEVTGTFDAELFNKKFDEDSLKLTSQADEAESTDEGIDISSIYDLELPVSETSVKKMLDSRTKTEKPISSWFLRQLLNSSNKGGIG